ncbi:uncharacterized protein LOC133330308 [Musca vetustissima]|uniref:uncharacterized protein LOC133330308 n=1 Tax=Musca vetustissima TaxID=27455 RepID=UPI002AB61088|nr:uncharacterized protein LOC133330308 [Musca vetustissima]
MMEIEKEIPYLESVDDFDIKNLLCHEEEDPDIPILTEMIRIVRRSTEEQRLLKPLEESILNFELNEPQTKGTQTEDGTLIDGNCRETINHNNEKPKPNLNDHERITQSTEDDNYEMTLDEKIEIFKRHLHNGHITTNMDIKKHGKKLDDKSLTTKKDRHPHHHIRKKESHKSDKQQQQHHHQRRRHHYHHRPYKENTKHQVIEKEHTTPLLATQPDHLETSSPYPQQIPEAVNETGLTKSIDADVVGDMENSNDSVALELARLFSEEKTELDEIFGIDPNQEPDDPQICKILKEIELAQVGGTQQTPNLDKTINHSPKLSLHINDNPTEQETPIYPATVTCGVSGGGSKICEKDLSNSLWPCELFMQKRKLSESLARLLEEDLRWHEIMKWKFAELFGDDSDDEFTPCSPSIELDDILMGSCVKRISPWVVKHLMIPMRHGLIGNRFVFKKLARHIARSIIMENQYPDESIIKGCIENYFCLHQAVMTLDDLQDVPSISLI